MAAALRQCNALPMAAQLWQSADAQLQRSLMTAVSAVASAGAWRSSTLLLALDPRHAQWLAFWHNMHVARMIAKECSVQ
jgi:hypothetical protein